ncbi:MAG TPA: PAS domain-containing protein [Novosphingobium sp.]|nr:PAS domain-containing protein [Novosphingobium sp.]
MGQEVVGKAARLLPFGLDGGARRLRERPLECFLGTGILVVAATAVRWLLGAGPAPFAAFYPAIIAASLIAGRATGYFAVVAFGLIAAYLFLPPDYSFAITRDGAKALAIHALVATFAVEIVAAIGRRAEALAQRQAMLTARAQELARREARTAASLNELEALYGEAPIGLGFLDSDLRFVRINQSLADMNGPSPAEHIGHCVWDIVPDLREKAEPMLRRVLETGETLHGVELRGETPARPGEQRVWVEMFYPVHDEDGQVHGVGVCCSDVTEMRRANERERLLSREVDHRAKNLLTVVQSVLHLTRSAKTIEEYRQAVMGRIQSLGRVHTVLAENRWDGVPMSDLIRQELAPYGSAVTIAGPEQSQMLPPSPAQAVSMILHELATNSAKHGALSDKGRVDLTCTSDNQRITLLWQELDGPQVGPSPHGSGFGTSLIQTAVKRLLGGTLDYRLEPDGLICEIAFPVPTARDTADLPTAG